MATTDLVTTAQTEPLSVYIRRPDVVEKFSLVLGSDREALTFVQSVLLLVQNSEPGDEYSLMNCSKQSIVREALRAATLRVSVDPALRQAWLIPRKNKGNIEAHLQLHYAEVRNRAMRTGRYWFINVGPVYQGETVFENIYTGLHQVKLANGLMTSPTEQDGFVAVGERAGEVKGWLGYSKTTKGQQQTVYMSKEDIAAFMDKGPTGSYWAKSKAWKNNREIMERKTVLLALLRKSDLSAPGMDEVKKVIELVDSIETVDAGPDLAALEDHNETIEGETTEATETKTEAEILNTLGFEKPALRYSPEVLRTRIQDLSKQYTSYKFSPAQDGLLASTLAGCFNGDDDKRKAIQYYLTGYQSLKEMPAGEKNALLKWVEPFKDDMGKYHPNEMSVREANAALVVAMKDAGQAQLI